MQTQPMRTAMILAAGNGSKLWPYNVVRQKAAFPIANVPIVRRLADNLAELGIEQIVVVVGAGEHSVRAALRGAAANVHFVRQTEVTGSADAVLHGAQGLEEDFLVVAGDVVTDAANLTAVVERFREERPLAAALVHRLGRERPQDWTVAGVDGDEVTGVVGHPRTGDHRLGGVYAFRVDMLAYLRDNAGVMRNVPVGGMPPVEAEIGQSLQLAIDEGQRLAAVEATGYHVDVDKPWHILEANERVLDSLSAGLAEDVIHPSARVHDGAEINGRVVLGPNAMIGNRVAVRGNLWLEEGAMVDNGAILEGHAVIGAQTKVRDYCLIGGHSSLGPHGIYGHGAEFTGVALDRVHCYHYCEIWGVVGSAVDFGAATVCGNLRFDDGETRWRVNGRSELPTWASNAAYFGDYSRTGVNAIIMPGKRTGVYSVVGAGVVLYEDLPAREMITLRQELERRPWGPEQYGW